MRHTAGLTAFVAGAALAGPAQAFAHANLLSTLPANGAVLAAAPREVTVLFDSDVRVAPGNAAVRNGGGSILGGKPVGHGRTLASPLRANLPRGDYSVRWSIVSQDGHVQQGVLAFAVGLGRAPPVPVLRPTLELGFGTVLARWLFFAGLLVASGLALFDVLVWRPLTRRGLPTGWIAIGLAAMFVSSHGLVHASHAGTATRFGLVVEIAAAVAATGAAAAAIGVADRSAAPFALALALAVLPVPTLAGHSLDPGRSWLEPPLDFLHVLAAAVWVGGLLALALVAPRVQPPPSPEVALAVTRRFSKLALASVLVIAGTGAGRALSELASFSQLWTTGYGRAITIKSGLFAVLVVLGWISRRRLERVRASATAELAVVLAVIVAVAVLTALPPGRRTHPVAPAAGGPARAGVPIARA